MKMEQEGGLLTSSPKRVCLKSNTLTKKKPITENTRKHLLPTINHFVISNIHPIFSVLKPDNPRDNDALYLMPKHEGTSLRKKV